MIKKIKWGILGTGSIADKFVSDFKLVDNGKVLAVGSRKLDSAMQFANRFNIANAYGSYLDLVNDPDVDIIYIATPHTFHFEHALLCLQHNKNVLCEKPVTVNALQFEILISESKSRNLFFMEAMWTPFLPAVQKALEWVNQGEIGQLQIIQVNFGIKGNSNPKGRLLNPELAGGALLDIGIYPLTVIEMFAQSKMLNFDVQANFSATGVDENIVIQLNFENGIMAQMASHINAQLTNNALIYGTKGSIEIPLFWMAKKAILRLNGQDEIVFSDATDTMGYNWEAVAVNNDLMENRTENIVMPLCRSMEMLRLMDKIRKRIDLSYPFE
jgi:predicted dehydrogenase